jgi:hypothetical protein
MTLYTIQILGAGSTSGLTELVCTYDNLAEITYILDQASPYIVLEYKISSAGGCVYSTNHFPFLCERLVTEFDWNKDYVPPPFEFESENNEDT